MYKEYINIYNDAKKRNPLLNINNNMFFVTDTQTISDFYSCKFNNKEDMAEINSSPDRFMPADNILIKVLDPKNKGIVYVSAHIRDDREITICAGGVLRDGSLNSEDKQRYLAITLSYILYKLSQKATQIHYQETSFRTNSGREKVVPVVFIRGEKHQTKYQHYLPSNPEWKHSWECVGHWRKHNGIGKDRYGEYNQVGRTWVLPHVKGEGDLIKKTRIVGN